MLNQTTKDGLERVNFLDAYDEMCSLQQCGPAGGSPETMQVWLGSGEGHRRMQLDRATVEELVDHLQAWLDTGSFQPATMPVMASSGYPGEGR